MHVVYILTFTERESNNDFPCYYIGSKSNSIFYNGKLLDKNNTPYWGSSEDVLFNELLKNDEPKKIEKLFEFEDYQLTLLKEKEIQEAHDVVANIKFFNKSIATICNYTDPNYATYKHILTNKIVRLERTHPLVLSGEYVGVTFGKIVYNNGEKETCFYPDEEIPQEWTKGRLQSSILCGEKNPFFGKKHTKNSTDKILKSRNKTYEDNPEIYQNAIQKLSINASARFKGVPKTEEHKRKLSESNLGYVTLKNKITEECIRIKNPEDYDPEIWINPFSFSRLKNNYEEVVCPYCNKISDSGNGIFKNHHFENCKFSPTGKGENWEPWNHKLCVNDISKLKGYFNLDILYELFLKHNINNHSSKKITLNIKQEFPFTWESVHSIILKKLRDGFNPYESKSWLKFKSDNSYRFKKEMSGNLETFFEG